jgi:hypothetical protein
MLSGVRSAINIWSLRDRTLLASTIHEFTLNNITKVVPTVQVVSCDFVDRFVCFLIRASLSPFRRLSSRLFTRFVIQSVLCLCGNFAEGLRMVHRQVGEHLAIQLDAGEL